MTYNILKALHKDGNQWESPTRFLILLIIEFFVTF
jgi:hypothetical protein